ncbi:ComF family protein [Thermorudis peleae]|uniref:ComF family protein n=1 Tax=Thermorudis peleae TaxID=1382356 RepID=UPI0024112B8A|nr:ComF family protein [Thermorudis peleae]
MQRFLSFLEDLVFPFSCLGCGRTGSILCADCARAWSLEGQPQCHRCGTPTPMPQSQCWRCQNWPPVLVTVRAPFRFDGPVRQAIHQLKYRGVRGAAPQLGRYLAAYAATELSSIRGQTSWAVVPIPLHPTRQRERGFNQAALLAKPVADALGIPVIHGLVRQQATRPQVGQSYAARQRNVAGAFAWRQGKQMPSAVILVDDVVTTGATMVAACEVLQAGGVQTVVGLALARHLLAGNMPHREDANRV